jgi:hypothetical protein
MRVKPIPYIEGGQGSQVLLLVGTRKYRSTATPVAPEVKGPYRVSPDPARELRSGPKTPGPPDQAGATPHAGPDSLKTFPRRLGESRLGETWTVHDEGLTFGEGGERVEKVWNVTRRTAALRRRGAGGLFRSDDGGPNSFT